MSHLWSRGTARTKHWERGRCNTSQTEGFQQKQQAECCRLAACENSLPVSSERAARRNYPHRVTERGPGKRIDISLIFVLFTVIACFVRLYRQMKRKPYAPQHRRITEPARGERFGSLPDLRRSLKRAGCSRLPSGAGRFLCTILRAFDMGILRVNLFRYGPTLSVTGFFPLNGLCFLLNESRRKMKESEKTAAVY